MLAIFLLIFIFVLYGVPTTQGAVWTDQEDYSPGDVVTIFGDNSDLAGYLPGETVHVDVVGPNGYTAACEGIADAAGAWSCQVTLWEGPIAYGSYTYTSNGLTSGVQETGTFTDAPPSIQQLWQCQPGPYDPTTFDCTTSGPDGWKTGNNDGPFKEGDTVPYRTRFQNLISTNQYRIQIEWDTSKADKHALDYLKTYNATVLSADPCLSLTGITCGAPTTYAIPPDSIMQSDPNWILYGASQDAGDFTIYNGTINSVSTYTLVKSDNSLVTEPPGTACTSGGCYDGDTSTYIDVIFTANDTDVVLAWGGHIGARIDWGPDNSAAFISGSPYHMRINEFYDVTNSDDLNVGNTDRSLSSDAVIFPGTITIIKDAQPDSDQDFVFNMTDDLGAAVTDADDNPIGNFLLDDDADGALPNTQSFSLLPGDYDITELQVGMWTLDSIACSVTRAGGGTPTSTWTPTIPDALDEGSVLIGLDEAETAICTFTNSLDIYPPDLTVIKDNDADGDLTFSDTETVPGDAIYPKTVPYQVTITNNSASDATITAKRSLVPSM
jgi:hypothetical protein